MSRENLQTWWKDAVIYQIYPLTFADSNGDGFGDLRGIISRLDYLNDGNPESQTSLGVDAIWLSPIFKTPMVDNGYDVSDYRDISPLLGTLEDFRALLEEAHRRGIKIILDWAVNHSSNEHSWFLESSADRTNPKADWYIWHDPVEGQDWPNNWLSYFGGVAWTFQPSRRQFYLHTFNRHQPDLNWRNPEVRAAIYEAMRFWLDMGVDGFRLDASSVYGKDELFRDNPLKNGAHTSHNYADYQHIYNKNLPINHDYIREIRAVIDEYDDRLLIGETFIDSPMYDSTIFHGNGNDELHLPLTFEFVFAPFHAGYLQRDIETKKLLTPAHAWPVYFFDNHDVPRHLSRWSKEEHLPNAAIAKAAATFLLTLRGTPILYYGQEIGMVDNMDIPQYKLRDNAVRDHSVVEAEARVPPRDGARSPMQWDRSPQAGFSFGKDVEPFLPVHMNYPKVNVNQGLTTMTCFESEKIVLPCVEENGRR